MVAIKPAKNFQVAEVQTPFIILGQMESKFQILGHHLGVPPGDGKFSILSSKYDSRSVKIPDFIGLVAHLNGC